MKCFNHPSVEAVGLCKSCMRALCHDCLTEVGMTISCKNRCESDVEAINEMLLRGRTAYQKASATSKRTGLLIMILGGAFALFGLTDALGSGASPFLLVSGTLFVALGFSSLLSAKRLLEK